MPDRNRPLEPAHPDGRADALRACEGNFRQLVAAVQEYAIFLLDPEGRVVGWNAAAECIKGYTAAEVVGRHFSCLYPPEVVAQGKPQRQLLVAGERGRIEDEGWRLRKDGTRFWANVVLTALRDERGTLRGFVKITRDLTERKAAEENERCLLLEQATRRGAEEAERQLRANEERLRIFVEHTPAAVAMFDRDMRCLLVSRRWLTDLDLGGQDVLGRSHYEIFPGIPERWKEAQRRCLAGAVEQCAEDRFQRRDGGVDWVRWKMRPWRDPEGETGGIVVFIEVITPRKQAEEALKESEQRFRQLAESINEVFWMADPQTTAVLYVSPAYEKVWGRSCPSLYREPRSFLDAVHPDDRDRVVAASLGRHSRGEPTDEEYRIVRPDGSIRWVRDRGFPIQDDTGEVYRFAGIAEDITERKQAEAGLRESEERFRSFMQHLPGLAWIKDVQGRYIYANAAAEKAFRTPRAALYGKTDTEVFPPATAVQFQEHDRRALASGTGVQVVETLEHGDGVLHHSLISKFPIPGPDGRTALVGGMAIDITDRLRAEKELQRQEEERRLAKQIQQGLLPQRMPTLAGFQIGGRSWSATDVGGDCFDFMPLLVGDQESLGVLVADASGHGIGAALLMAETRAYLRALSLACMDVGALLGLSNRRLARDSVLDHFVTLLLLRLDLHNRYLLYASAGHCPGYVLDRQGRTQAVLASTGIPLGINPASVFPESSAMPLERGGLVFLFTDGIVEAASPAGNLFGLERALAIVRAHQHRTPDEILEAVFDAVGGFSEHRLHDDMTAVIIKAEGVA